MLVLDPVPTVCCYVRSLTKPLCRRLGRSMCTPPGPVGMTDTATWGTGCLLGWLWSAVLGPALSAQTRLLSNTVRGVIVMMLWSCVCGQAGRDCALQTPCL